MKFLISVAFISTMLFACKPTSEEERTARYFLKSLSQGDYEKARRYVVPSSLPLLYDFETIGIPPDFLQAHPIAWSIDSIVKQGDDSAKVYYLWNGLPEEIQMVKEKGRWKVVF